MSESSFDCWAIVDLMGHLKMAGRVTEIELGGGKLLRIDVPETEKNAAFTRFFGVSAIYSLTPVTEDVAREISKTVRAEPITQWDIPDEWKAKIRGLPAPSMATRGRELHSSCEDPEDEWDEYDEEAAEDAGVA